MSYEPPFEGSWMTEYARLARNDKPPPSIQRAVRYIYAGAIIEVLSVILEIAGVRRGIQSVLATASATPIRASELNIDEAVVVGLLLLGGAIGVSLWCWMAIKNKAGRRWARILSTVFFVIFSLALVAVIAEPVAVESKIIPVATWVVGLLATAHLWQRESSDFYAARSRRH